MNLQEAGRGENVSCVAAAPSTNAPAFSWGPWYLNAIALLALVYVAIELI